MSCCLQTLISEEAFSRDVLESRSPDAELPPADVILHPVPAVPAAAAGADDVMTSRQLTIRSSMLRSVYMSN